MTGDPGSADGPEPPQSRVEQELRERVKELSALREVQVAIETSRTREELFERAAAAVVEGMQFPDRTRVEIHLDGRSMFAGREGDPVTSMGVDVVVDGVVRGDLTAGYVEQLAFIEPEERNMLQAVSRTLGMYVGLVDARAAARDSEERLRRVLDGLPSAVLSVDRDYMVEAVTLAADFPSSLEPGSIGPMLDWEDPGRDQLAPVVADALAGEPVRKVVSWRGGWWELRAEPQRTAEGTVERALVLVLDVTDQRRRQEVEARLASIVESASVAIVGLELDGTITSWNRGAVQLFGWEAGQMIGRPVDLLDPPGDEETSARSRVEAFARGELGEGYVEATRRHRDGHPVRVGIHLSFVRDVDGNLVGASAIYQDLTARDRAVRALEASEKQFRVIAETVQDVVYRMALEPDPRLEYVSPSASQLFGFDPEVLIADPEIVVRRTHREDRVRMLDTMREVRSTGTGSLRVRWRHAGGHWIWIEDLRRVVEQEGRPVAVIGVVRDVTGEQIEAEATRAELHRQQEVSEQLRRVDQMKTTFLSAVSHELRTPLTIIVGLAETAVRLAGVGDGRVDELLERIAAHGRRLEQLVDDLLDVDRLARGAIEPRRRHTDLAALVRNVIVREETAGLVLDLDVEPVTVAVDAAMIERIVDNLVRNVRRHTPEGTTCRLWLRATDGGARLVVEDDGPGIEHELRERVFEPFTQGESTADSATPGTGIGLSLVRRFVEVHDGTISLDDRPGGGTRFTIELPDAGEAAG